MSNGSSKRVRLKGVDDLARGCRTALTPALKAVGEEIGQQTARRVRSHVQSIVPHQSGRLAASVEATKVKGGAKVGYDGSVPYAGPVDFGGYPAGRPYRRGGRYLYPSARAASREFKAKLDAAAGRAVKDVRWPRPT